jgi:hypothetical protein
MKRKILYSMMLAILITLGTSKTSQACGSFGPTCNTYLDVGCDGMCDGDVCQGHEVNEYACSDGSIQYIIQ